MRKGVVAVATWSMVTFALAARADALLYNFDSPGRVPGEFAVEFRLVGETKDPGDAAAPLPRPLPTALPATESEAKRIAAVLAARVGARLCGVEFSSMYHGFTICDADPARVRELLAKDPRIRAIHASIETRLLR